MSRRALRVWAGQHRRLWAFIRARHRLILRLPPGQAILELVGLAPRRPGHHHVRALLSALRDVSADRSEELGFEGARDSASAGLELLDGEPSVPGQDAPGAELPSARADSGHDRPRHVQPTRRLASGSRPPAPTSESRAEQSPASPRRAGPIRPAASEGGINEPGDEARDRADGPEVPAELPPTDGALLAAEEALPAPPSTPRPAAAVAEPSEAEPVPSATTSGTSPRPVDRTEAQPLPSGEMPAAPERIGEASAAVERVEAEQAPMPTPRSKEVVAGAPVDAAPARAPQTEPQAEAAAADGSGLASDDRVEGGVTSLPGPAHATSDAAFPTSSAPAKQPEPPSKPPSSPGSTGRVVEERHARRPPAEMTGLARRSVESRPEAKASRPPVETGPTASGHEETDSETVAGPVERPIGEWRRLLIEATEPSAAPSRRAPSPAAAASPSRSASPEPPHAPPAPLLEGTRRLLRPLVGIDPDSVRVHRGARATEAAAAAHADALAIGDDVVLPDSQGEGTPEGLGLLAHELTHVARTRSPRFVPPIVRAGRGRRAGPAVGDGPANARAGERPEDEVGEEGPELGEEPLARRVEGRVRAAARKAIAEPSHASRSGPAGTASVGASSGPRRQPAVADTPWGDLPAPWEPLPDLGGEVSPAHGPSSGGDTGAAATVYRADPERTVDEHAEGGHSAPAAPVAPPPDLDALAQQVYQVLKRRLATERRREG